MLNSSWCRHFVSAMLATAALFFVGASQANAGNILLQVEHDGDVQNFSGTSTALAELSITVGDYTIVISAGTTSASVPGFSSVLTTTNTTIMRNSITANSGNLFIRVLRNDFDDPTGDPMYVGSALSATLTGQAGDSTLTFTSFFDDANRGGVNDYGPAGSDATDAVTISANPLLVVGEGGRADTIIVDRTLENSPFALSSILEVNLLNTTVSASTTGVTEVRANPFGPNFVPEPSSIALACMGLVGFGGYARRRIKARA